MRWVECERKKCWMMMHLACQWVSELVRELVGEFVLAPLTRRVSKERLIPSHHPEKYKLFGLVNHSFDTVK